MRRLWRSFGSWIWNLSEDTGIPLGRAAPWVFGQSIGCRYKKIEKEDES
jgi:hypothetical protein